MSAIVLEDFVRPFTNSRGRTLTDRQAWYVMRLVVLLVGVLCVSLVMLVERAGTVFQLTSSVEAITCGPLLGIFTAGMLIHWVNEKVDIKYIFDKLLYKVKVGSFMFTRVQWPVCFVVSHL